MVGSRNAIARWAQWLGRVPFHKSNVWNTLPLCVQHPSALPWAVLEDWLRQPQNISKSSTFDALTYADCKILKHVESMESPSPADPMHTEHVFELTQPSKYHFAGQINDPSARQPVLSGYASQIRVHPGVCATWIETQGVVQGPHAVFGRLKQHIDLAEGAELTLIRFIDMGQESLQLNEIEVKQAPNSRFHEICVVYSARMLHQTVRVVLQGKNAKARYDVLNLATGRQYSTQDIQIVHEGPETHSEVSCRAIAAQHGKISFLNPVDVQQTAMGARTQQKHDGLLLNANARIISEPHLKIKTDEVQARHGSAIGEWDHKALLYLMTRGLSETQAKLALLEAFSQNIFSDLPPDIKTWALNRLREWWHELA